MRTNNKALRDTQTNTAIDITVPAGVERRVRLELVSASVSAGTAVLAITCDAVTIWEEPVTAAAPARILFGEDGWQSTKAATDVHVTLTAAGSGNVGRVNVLYHAE